MAALRALNLPDAPRNERFERVVDAAQERFGMLITCLTLVDAERQWMAALRGPMDKQTRLEGTICRTAMWAPETVQVCR